MKGIVKYSIPNLPISLSNVSSQIIKEAGIFLVNVYLQFHALFAAPLYLPHDRGLLHAHLYLQNFLHGYDNLLDDSSLPHLSHDLFKHIFITFLQYLSYSKIFLHMFINRQTVLTGTKFYIRDLFGILVD